MVRNAPGGPLSHVFWIGGSTFSGKTSVSEILSKRCGLDLYHCDDRFRVHQEASTPDRQPVMHLLSGKLAADAFLLPPSLLLEGVKAMAREEFGMIVLDLEAVAESGSVIAEGAPLIPESVQKIPEAEGAAVWIVSGESFLRNRYESARSGMVRDVLNHYGDPERAFRNWMDRDVLFGKWIEENARSLGAPVITNDGVRPLQEIADEAASILGLS